jgi:8-oxo-dGTP diphosphatase
MGISMQKNQPKIGIGVIVVKDSLVLLGKRKGSHGSGDWSFPGGHLELHETPEECAYRELIEETGLEASHTCPGPWTNDIFDHGKHYVTLFMFVTEFTGEPKVLEPHKCENWEWFEWDDLPHPLFTPIQTLVKNIGLKKLMQFKEYA